MKKRRAEIAVLAALIVFAAVERPAIDFRPDLYQVGEFTPQRVETVRDLSLIAVKLLVKWVG